MKTKTFSSIMLILIGSIMNAQFITNYSVGDNLYSEYVLSVIVDSYPNPVIGTLNICNVNKINKIMIFDISGKLLLAKYSKENHNSIDLSNFVSGIYFVKVFINNQVFTGKIVKY